MTALPVTPSSPHPSQPAQPASLGVCPNPSAPQQPSSSPPPRLWALLPCAGSGSRAVAGAGLGVRDATLPKQYQQVAGAPLVLHTLAALGQVARLHRTLVAVAPGDVFFATHGDPAQPPRYASHPCGGPTRAATVLGGLQVLTSWGAIPEDWVLVHDAARCLVTPQAIDALIDACLDDPVGGLLATPLADTLKAASPAHPSGVRVQQTLERSDKWLAQTPQMFRLGLLQQALQQAGPGVTDEASAIEQLGLHPRLVPSSGQNLKVTYPDDFLLAEALLLHRQRLHVAA